MNDLLRMRISASFLASSDHTPHGVVSSTPRVRVPADARWHANLHGLAPSVHEISGFGMRAGSGFSLVELMVVLAIFVVGAAIAVPRYIDWLPRARVNGAMNQLYTELQLAKMRAVSENRNYVVTFNNVENSYTITGGEAKTIFIESNFTGIEYGYVAGTDKAVGGGSIDDEISFSGDEVTFWPTGLANKSGSVYLKPKGDAHRRDRQRAVTVATTGSIRTHRHTASQWK